MQHDDNEPLASRLLDAIAAHRGVDVSALDFILHDAIDPDALNRLARSKSDDWLLSLSIGGHTVTVDGDGLILVDGDQPTRPESDRS